MTRADYDALLARTLKDETKRAQEALGEHLARPLWLLQK